MKLFAIISWLLLLFLSPSACTFDPSHARPPLGPLGVTLDFVFATNWPTEAKASGSRNWSWSSHLVFTQPVHDIFTDRELWIIGWHAYQEMRADVVQYGINPKHPKYNPRAMTLLAFGNEIILASSQKGLQSFSYSTPDTPVLIDLNRCAMAWRDEGNPEQPEHRRGAKCGEEMVCHLYALNNRDQELRTRNPSISTWAAAGSIDNPAPTPPCGNPVRADVSFCPICPMSHQFITCTCRPIPSSQDVMKASGS